MLADLCYSRWWHWATEGTSQSQSRQGCLTSTGDVPYILCHWVWSCCNMCWQNHQCSTKVPSTLKATTEASLTVLELHMPAPIWGVIIALPKSLSAKFVWRKHIGKPSVIPGRKTNPLLQWTANQKLCLASMERKGRGLTSLESTLRNHNVMRFS